MDELGRIVLPKELRDILSIKKKDRLEISLDGSRIIIEKYEQVCAICDSRINLRPFAKKKICNDCIKTVKET